MAILNNLLAILMVVIGLGFVIFIHELGHFLLAKWNGVKVEKFAVGFDVGGLRLYSKQVGETLYVLGAIPLGGYVKMLGEDAGDEEKQEQAKDPRAYHNKPVGARMAIISAGVVMNMVFGLACFTYVYLRGKLEVPPVIGAVIAGMPAFEAGVQPGDTIVAVDGNRVETYSDLQHATIFSGKGQVLQIDLKRPGQESLVRVEVAPRLKEGGMAPTIGITSSSDLTLRRILPFLKPPGMTGEPEGKSGGFLPGDQVVQVGPADGPLQPVESMYDLDRVLVKYLEQPLTFEVRRAMGEDSQNGSKSSGSSAKVTVPPNHFVDFGFRLVPGPVVAIRKDSIAAKAGFQEGDRILAVDGRSDFDPMRLPSEMFAHAGQPLSVEVERAARGKQAPEIVTLTATPDDSPIWTEPVWSDEALEIPGLGLAIAIEPKITTVIPGTPAELARLKPGDIIEAVTLTLPPDPEAEKRAGKDENKPETLTLVLGDRKPAKGERAASWPAAFDQIQTLPRHAVQFRLAGQADPIRMTPEPVSDWYHPRRGLQFKELTRPLPPQSLLSAMQRAWGDTIENVASIFFMIRGLFQRTLSKDAVGGPIKIADWAYSTARLGFDAFIPFLGMLSINLAVINFFPIPPLDGGQLMFLIGEKIYGRPLPEKAVGPITIGGLVLLLALILFVNLNDVLSYFWT